MSLCATHKANGEAYVYRMITINTMYIPKKSKSLLGNKTKKSINILSYKMFVPYVCIFLRECHLKTSLGCNSFILYYIIFQRCLSLIIQILIIARVNIRLSKVSCYTGKVGHARAGWRRHFLGPRQPMDRVGGSADPLFF